AVSGQYTYGASDAPSGRGFATNDPMPGVVTMSPSSRRAAVTFRTVTRATPNSCSIRTSEIRWWVGYSPLAIRSRITSAICAHLGCVGSNSMSLRGFAGEALWELLRDERAHA